MLSSEFTETIKTAISMSLTRDYLEGIDYKNGQLEAVYHQEGRALSSGGGFRQEYVLRDHLGSSRVVFSDKDNNGGIDHSEMLGEYHYYPFGQTMAGAWYQDASAVPYRYGYNGKERVAEFSLNFYDYGARWYDPNLGSWWQIDPLSEVSRRWSPYVFSNNNPLRFIDPDGMDVQDAYTQWVNDRDQVSAMSEQQGLSAYSALDGDSGDPPKRGKSRIEENMEKYSNKEKKATVSYKDASKRFSGLTYEQLMTAEWAYLFGLLKHRSILYDFKYRYIRDPLNVGKEVDFIHFLEAFNQARQIGSRSAGYLGLSKEIEQGVRGGIGQFGESIGISNSWAGAWNSAFSKQDLYSNRLGIMFEWQFGTMIQNHPDRLMEYFSEFISNPILRGYDEK